MLILMAGLPGSGKSTVARRLAEHLHGAVLSKDTLRHALFPPELVEYSSAQDDFVIELLLQTAEYIWKRARSKIVILDGRTFSRASQRRHVIEFAEKQHQEWRIVECVCADDMARARLAKVDSTLFHPAANRTPELYNEVRRRWEPIAEPKLTVKTDAPVNFAALIERLQVA